MLVSIHSRKILCIGGFPEARTKSARRRRSLRHARRHNSQTYASRRESERVREIGDMIAAALTAASGNGAAPAGSPENPAWGKL